MEVEGVQSLPGSSPKRKLPEVAWAIKSPQQQQTISPRKAILKKPVLIKLLCLWRQFHKFSTGLLLQSSPEHKAETKGKKIRGLHGLSTKLSLLRPEFNFKIKSYAKQARWSPFSPCWLGRHIIKLSHRI